MDKLGDGQSEREARHIERQRRWQAHLAAWQQSGSSQACILPSAWAGLRVDFSLVEAPVGASWPDFAAACAICPGAGAHPQRGSDGL